MKHRVEVLGIPSWVDAERLLGFGPWEGETSHCARLESHQAAEVQARLRQLVLGGQPLQVTVEPSLGRPLVRQARLDEARRQRDTTPGFEKAGTKKDEQGRISLTPEVLAMAMATSAKGMKVVDAGCGLGGNAIAFARHGCEVTAIETNSRRLEMARHNARVYGVEERIDFITGPVQEVLRHLSGDLLFVDPPWEGLARERCTIDDFSLLSATLEVARQQHRFRFWWAKVPPSFAWQSVPDAEPQAWFGERPGDYRRVKLLILRLDLARPSPGTTSP